MRPGGLLTLDLAKVVGWAHGHPGDGVPNMGTIDLGDTNVYGRRMMAFENALIDLIERFHPAQIVPEAPLPAYAQNNEATARLQIGLSAYVHGEAARYAIPVEEVSAQLVRMTLLGQARLNKAQKSGGITMKDLVMAECQRLGMDPPDHNAADAALTWRFMMDRNWRAPNAQRSTSQA